MLSTIPLSVMFFFTVDKYTDKNVMFSRADVTLCCRSTISIALFTERSGLG